MGKENLKKILSILVTMILVTSFAMAHRDHVSDKYSHKHEETYKGRKFQTRKSSKAKQLPRWKHKGWARGHSRTDTYKLSDKESGKGTLFIIYKDRDPFNCYIELRSSLTMRGKTNKVSVISRFGEREDANRGMASRRKKTISPYAS